jgi:hypothetical protein
LIHDSLNKTFIIGYYNEDIENLEEIIDLYTEDELYKIGKIEFIDNRINTLKGLSKFGCNEIDFSNNNLTLIDDLPHFNTDFNYGSDLELKFNNNKSLKEFTNEAVNHLYTNRIRSLAIYLIDCDDFNYASLSKIDFNQIQQKSESSSFRVCIWAGKNVEIPTSLKQIGFVKEGSCWGLGFGFKKTGCFIATATMGSYDHPMVMELRDFRDNWILEKSWGEGFVKWYYHYGSKVAIVIEKSYILKKICYITIVKPLYVISKIIKQ